MGSGRRKSMGMARTWVLACAWLALAVKVIVPAGFMAGSVDGHAALVPCIAYDAVQQAHPQSHLHHAGAAHDGQGHAGHGTHEAHDGHQCPFPAALAAGLGTAGIAHAPPPAATLAADISFRQPVLAAAVPPRYRAPRGPPTSA